MHTNKKILSGLLSGAILLSASPAAFAATVHYNDSSVTGGSAAWNAYVENWSTLAADYTKVSLTPGRNETELNFAWYSSDNGSAATPVVHFGTDRNNLTAYTGTSGDVDDSLTDGAAYHYNHVTVTGLQENTTYYYTVEKNGVQSAVETYRTGDFDSIQMLYVGDPQVGASKGQPQNGETLSADSGAANTAARNDGFAWNRTLNIAMEENPGIDFIISAGDQVNKTGQPKEEEYAAYLSADVLASVPVATTIGNHDSLNPDYMYHFNNPNATEYGATEAGGDYYYSYGEGLFIVLNTNNYNAAEHAKAIEEAIASDPDAAWRVVTIHQDIYGSGLDHSDTDGMILRTQLTPIFDEYDIDVVLQGHDHTYSRTKMLYGDGKTHGTYEFRLNEDGSDYDWDHAYNTQNDQQIPLYPEEGDAAGTAAQAAFQQDNLCYTIEQTEGNTVRNPEGILYMTANSASGSKYYELISTQQDYVAARSQNWLPSYSVITMDADSFSIDTYQITDDGKAEKIDDTFTIIKDGTASTEVITRADAAAFLYNLAGAPAATSTAAFSDVDADADYADAVAWAKAEGIVTGTSAATFDPESPVTREQLYVMAYRYAKAMGLSTAAEGTDISGYSDAKYVSSWALGGVRFAAGTGMLTGSSIAPKTAAASRDIDAALTQLNRL